MVQNAEANADSQVRVLMQRLDERQRNLAYGHRVLASLDIHVRDALGAMMNQQIRNLLVFRSIPFQSTVTAPHPAIKTVLAAKIGDFHDRANEYVMAEPRPGKLCSPLVKGGLGFATRVQQLGGRQDKLIHELK